LPSIPTTIYASVAEVSGIKLLIAGIVPALVITLCLCVQVWYFARKYNFPRDARAPVAGATPYGARGAPCPGDTGDSGLRPLFGWFGLTELAAFTVFYCPPWR
jgi:hypothetical protein